MGLRKAASRAEPLLVDLSELGDSTRRVRQQAEAQAQVVHDRAVQEAQTLRDEARTSGFDEGYAAGLQEGRAEGIQQAEAARAKELQSLVDQLQQAVVGLIAQTESCELPAAPHTRATCKGQGSSYWGCQAPKHAVNRITLRGPDFSPWPCEKLMRTQEE